MTYLGCHGGGGGGGGGAGTGVTHTLLLSVPFESLTMDILFRLCIYLFLSVLWRPLVA